LHPQLMYVQYQEPANAGDQVPVRMRW
jgi:hypothetical protein